MEMRVGMGTKCASDRKVRKCSCKFQEVAGVKDTLLSQELTSV